MASWIGDSLRTHGPLVLSAHAPAAWTRLRAASISALMPYQRGVGDEPPVVVDVDGPVLVLPGGCETAWHARPWGGFLARMLQLENTIAQDAGAKWKPDDTRAFVPTDLRILAKGPLHFVDLALRSDAPDDNTLALDLAPGTYAIDVAHRVAPDRRRIFEVIRLRRDGVELSAQQSAKTVKLAGWPEGIAPTATTKKLAKALKLAESEGAELLLVSGDDYAKGKRGIVLDSPDPSGFLVQGDQIIVYRQLAADDLAQAVAIALAVPEARWKNTRKRVVVGKSRALYLVDGDAEPEDVLARKRLGSDATRIDVTPGTYTLSTTGEIHAEGAILELYRLRRA